jgi:CRISPR-associated protein Cas2
VYVIVVYDIEEKRVGKVCKFMKRYLPRVQNSVFEGDLSEAKLEQMKVGLVKIMEPPIDAVLLWVARDSKWIDRQVLGAEKLPVTTFF